MRAAFSRAETRNQIGQAAQKVMCTVNIKVAFWLYEGVLNDLF